MKTWHFLLIAGAILAITLAVPFTVRTPEPGRMAKEREKLAAIHAVWDSYNRTEKSPLGSIAVLRDFAYVKGICNFADSRWTFVDPNTGKAADWIVSNDPDQPNEIEIRSPRFSWGRNTGYLQAKQNGRIGFVADKSALR